MTRGGYARYTLDNRPTSLLVKEAPLEQAENLRKHFEVRNLFFLIVAECILF